MSDQIGPRKAVPVPVPVPVQDMDADADAGSDSTSSTHYSTRDIADIAASPARQQQQQTWTASNNYSPSISSATVPSANATSSVSSTTASSTGANDSTTSASQGRAQWDHDINPSNTTQIRAFADLVRGFDSYVTLRDPNQKPPVAASSASASSSAQHFQPLQMLQDLHFCGGPKTKVLTNTVTSTSTAVMEAKTMEMPSPSSATSPASSSSSPTKIAASPHRKAAAANLLPAPSALRHTHSSPLVHSSRRLAPALFGYDWVVGAATSSNTAASDSHAISTKRREYGGGRLGTPNDTHTHTARATGDDVPPPAPLDLFQRSSSTPSAFRQRSVNSAFGTVDHHPRQYPHHHHHHYHNSAFSLPHHPSQSPLRASFTAMSDPGSFHSAFDPVYYYARALEDMERTSIEVMDTTPDRSKAKCVADVSSSLGAEAFGNATSLGEETNNNSSTSNNKTNKQAHRFGAASRAARFLSDVRVLRRRRRVAGGRENPAKPADSSPDSSNPSDSPAAATAVVSVQQDRDDLAMDTSVTIITETDFNPNDTSIMSRSSEVSAIVRGAFNQNVDEDVAPMHDGDQDDYKEDDSPSQYHQLDSDAEEDDSDDDDAADRRRYHTSQVHVESPATVPSPSYQHFDELVMGSPIQSHNHLSGLPGGPIPLSGMMASTGNYMKPSVRIKTRILSSPSPSQLETNESTNLTPRSNESATASPRTARSSFTGSSFGHTTQATSISSVGHHSALSTISETDREVMEANKEGKRRRGLDRLVPSHRRSNRKSETDGTSIHSSSTNSTNPHSYVALANSPAPLREGANVPAERFFVDSSFPMPNHVSQSAVAMMFGLMRKSGSATPSGTSENGSTTHTTSSASTTGDEPLQFVSYFDRGQTQPAAAANAAGPPSTARISPREAVETSTPRDRGTTDDEQREGSPADLLLGDYSAELLFEEAKAPLDASQKQKQRLASRAAKRNAQHHHHHHHRLRSPRPPRSPAKGTSPSSPSFSSRPTTSTPPPRGSESPVLVVSNQQQQQSLSPQREMVPPPIDSSWSSSKNSSSINHLISKPFFHTNGNRSSMSVGGGGGGSRISSFPQTSFMTEGSTGYARSSPHSTSSPTSYSKVSGVMTTMMNGIGMMVAPVVDPRLGVANDEDEDGEEIWSTHDLVAGRLQQQHHHHHQEQQQQQQLRRSPEAGLPRPLCLPGNNNNNSNIMKTGARQYSGRRLTTYREGSVEITNTPPHGVDGTTTTTAHIHMHVVTPESEWRD